MTAWPQSEGDGSGVVLAGALLGNVVGVSEWLRALMATGTPRIAPGTAITPAIAPTTAQIGWRLIRERLGEEGIGLSPFCGTSGSSACSPLTQAGST